MLVTHRIVGVALRAVMTIALVVGLLAHASPSAWAQVANSAQQVNPVTQAKQAILMDADSGAVLFQQRADEQMVPASMSKLMTLAVIFRALKMGQVKLEDEFLMSANAWRKGGGPSGTSAMLVPVNTRERLDQYLQGIIVQSGNDACIAVAEGMAGSEEAFAKLMTEEGRRIGLKNSNFANATGLYHPDHLMTARDLATLARYIIREYPDHYARFAQRDYNYRKHRFQNRNPLLAATTLGVDGMKTGFVKEGGYSIVASAKQENRRLILVVSGYDRQDERKSDAIRMLEWGFKSFTEFKLFDAGEVVAEARVFGGTKMHVPLTGNGDVAVILPRFPANQRLKAEIVYKGPLKTPVKKGDPVATLRVTSSTQAVNEVQLYAGEDVDNGGMVRRGFDSILHMIFRGAL